MFAASEYRYSVPLRGSAAAAFDIARTALLSQGFEILHDSADELSAEGPGMQSNRQPAIVGASRMCFRVASSTLSVTATLGGVARMKAFVYLFPPGLVLVLYGTFRLAGMAVPWQILLAAAPWIVVAPVMVAGMRRRTTRAVERLVRGMAQAAAKKA